MTKHPVCRPPRNAKPIKSEFHRSEKLWRLGDNKRWVADDGRPGLAFIGSLPKEPETAVVWVANCKCSDYGACPVAKALAFAVDKLDIQMTTIDRRKASR